MNSDTASILMRYRIIHANWPSEIGRIDLVVKNSALCIVNINNEFTCEISSNINTSVY